jgi:transposase-like protein
VSTRRVDDLVRALGLDGISRSEVSWMGAAFDAGVETFRRRSLTDERYPYRPATPPSTRQRAMMSVC